jgi:hypothetical protein
MFISQTHPAQVFHAHLNVGGGEEKFATRADDTGMRLHFALKEILAFIHRAWCSTIRA